MDLFNEAKKRGRPFIINKSIGHGNICASGEIGTGKSTGLLVIAERYYENKKIKLFDLSSGRGRMEGAYWCLPSEIKILNSSKMKVAKAYPTTLLFPHTHDLPSYNKIPRASRIFTIPVNSLDYDDIYALIGKNVPAGAQAIWNKIQAMTNDYTSALDFRNLLKRIAKGEVKIAGRGEEEVKTTVHGLSLLVNNVIDPLFRLGLLSSGKNAQALNLKEEIKDNENISVLILKYFPKELRHFLIHYFVNHIFDINAENHIKPTYLILRELANLLSTREDNPAGLAIKNSVSNILREARSGTYFLVDTQILTDLPDERAEMHINLLYRQTIYYDLTRLLGIKERSGLFSSDDIVLMPMLQKRHCYVYIKGKRAFLTKMLIPKHRFWKERDNFETIYHNVDGKYMEKEEYDRQINDIKQESEKSRDEWEARQISKRLAKQKKEEPKEETKPEPKPKEQKEEIEPKIKESIEEPTSSFREKLGELYRKRRESNQQQIS